MATSRFLSLTYCQLVVLVVVVGASTLGLNADARIGYGRHGNVIRRIYLCAVIMLCANAFGLCFNYDHRSTCKLNRSIMIYHIGLHYS